MDHGNLALDVTAAGLDRPDHPALLVVGSEGPQVVRTHADLSDAIARRAGGLARLSLPPQARVMLRLGNTPDFPILFLACAAAGLVPVATSAALTDVEVAKQAEVVAPALAIAADGLPVPPGVPVAMPGELAAAPLARAEWARGPVDRLGYIVFTSGSGGTPKAVAHAHRAIRARRLMWDGWYGLRRTDRVMHAGAFNWTYTLGTGLLDPWAIGATAVIPAAGTPTAALPELMAATGATIFAAVPGIYRRLLRTTMPALPSLRHGLSAGERLPDGIRTGWRDATGTDIHEALGMSECSTFVSGSPARPAPPGTSGYAQPGRSIDVAEGRLRISTRDPGLMLGYWRDGAPVPPDGPWFETGDRVACAPDGAIRYVGRADDILNPGGHRVSPLEIEEALTGLPVEDLAVGQVTVAGGATVLAAYYVGAPLDEAAADGFAATRLAAWKRPRLWLRRARLPRNANGKLRRRELA